MGFDKKVWAVVDRKEGETPSITFKYHSADGEEGTVYPSLYSPFYASFSFSDFLFYLIKVILGISLLLQLTHSLLRHL